MKHSINSKNIEGFYFHFAAKFHSVGRAHYCKLEDFNNPWGRIENSKCIIAERASVFREFLRYKVCRLVFTCST